MKDKYYPLPKIVRYFFVSCGALVVDTLLVYLLYRTLGLGIVFSNTIGVATGFIFSYLFVAKYVFSRAKGDQGFITFFLTFLGGLVLANALIYLGETSLFISCSPDISFFLSKGLSIAVPFFAMYFVRKGLYAYADRHNDQYGWFRILPAIVILFCFALLIYWMIWNGKYYGSGNDIWGHFYKTEMIYQGIINGNPYPLYSPDWYNGIQLYRYWAPLSYYALAGLRMLVGGSMETAYYLFFGAAAFLGGLPWILMGISKNKTVLGIAIAMLWFLMPDNIRVFLNEGNLPRMLAITIVPYLVLFLWIFIRKKKALALVGLMVVMSALVLSHVMIAAMAGVSVFIFLIIDCISNKGYLQGLFVLGAMIAGIMMAGIWLVPAMFGGIVGMNSSSTQMVLESLAFDIQEQLDPMIRLRNSGEFYFGLAIIVLSIFGIIFAGKKGKAGFVFPLFLLVAISPSFLPILKAFPVSELFWMIRFTTFAYGFYFFSLLEWETLKKWVVAVLVLILFLDCIPGLNFELFYANNSEELAQDVEYMKGETKQRIALMDLSLFGSYPSWGLIEGDKKEIGYTFGWAWQGAETADDIVLLNTALENGNFLYLFDRCLSMGNDTVVLTKEQVRKGTKRERMMLSQAAALGYVLEEETEKVYLFKLETPYCFGVKTEYLGIAIGQYAKNIPLYFPEVSAAYSNYLDDYSLSELDDYSAVILSGFSYHDQEKAEALVRKLANRGVKFIIDVNQAPYNVAIQDNNFMGIEEAGISFVNHYPDMYYNDQLILPKGFSEEYRNWMTKYIVKVDHITGYTDYSGERLIWAGYNENENIIYIGLNVMFHAMEQEDTAFLDILSDLTGVNYREIPKRKIVPLDIVHYVGGFSVTSAEDGVNTTLAYQDIFRSDMPLGREGNFLIVDKGKTVVTFDYPMKKQGIYLSLAGFLLGLCVLLFYRRHLKKEGRIKLRN